MTQTPLQTRLLDAALPLVPFDGWSEATFRAATEAAGATPAQARAAFPRGAVGMALAFHDRADAALAPALAAEDLSQLRYRDKVARAIRLRLDLIAPEKEAVRRAVTLFALPQHAPDGARALWSTADAIWEALGDTSRDVNWYTKRATLAGVWSAVLLYWLGDQSEGARDTRDFIDRRIDDVMRIETAKAKARKSKVLSGLMAGPNLVLDRIRAPARTPRTDLPGLWRPEDG